MAYHQQTKSTEKAQNSLPLFPGPSFEILMKISWRLISKCSSRNGDVRLSFLPQKPPSVWSDSEARVASDIQSKKNKRSKKIIKDTTEFWYLYRWKENIVILSDKLKHVMLLVECSWKWKQTLLWRAWAKIGLQLVEQTLEGDKACNALLRKLKQ